MCYAMYGCSRDQSGKRTPAYPLERFIRGILDFCNNTQFFEKKTFSRYDAKHIAYDMISVDQMCKGSPFHRVWRKSLCKDGRVVLVEKSNLYTIHIGVTLIVHINPVGRIIALHDRSVEEMGQNFLRKIHMYQKMIEEGQPMVCPWTLQNLF